MAATATARTRRNIATAQHNAAVKDAPVTPEPILDPDKCRTKTLSDGTVVTEMFRVSFSHLSCLMGAMPREDVRGYLNGIYLDADLVQPFLVATNGMIMARCPVYLDHETHRPVIDHLIWSRFQEKNPVTKLRRFDYPDQLIFMPEKLPAATSGLVAVDLNEKRIWSVEKTGPRFESRILVLQNGTYPNWRRVDTHWPGAFTPATEPRPVTIDLAMLAKVYHGPVTIESPNIPQASYRITLGIGITECSDVKVTMQGMRDKK